MRKKKYQVLGYVEGLLAADAEKSKMDIKEWLRKVDEFREEMRANYGENFTIDVQSMLDEIREEPTDERLGRT